MHSIDYPTSIKSQGHFIVFEGIDGSGKTTQADMLTEHLQEAGFRVTQTQEPSETIGKFINQLKDNSRQNALSHVAELLLFEADRSQHIKEVIQPSLDRGEIVLCDRYTPSSLAYQGYGRGLELEMVEQINHLAIGECVPDATIYLLLPIEISWARIVERRKQQEQSEVEDRFEKKALHERVSRAYKEIAKNDPKGLVFDAQLKEDELAEKIRSALRQKQIVFS